MENLEKSKKAIETFGPLPKTMPIPERDDSLLAEWAAEYLFKDKVCFVDAFGWMYFDGKRWAPVADVLVIEYYRLGIELLREKLLRRKSMSSDLQRFSALSSKSRMRSVVDTMKGPLFQKGSDFDSNPDIVVTQNCVVDLKLGKTRPHSPTDLFTKVTAGSYIAGSTHPDFEKVLSALDDDETAWLQELFGQGITGHPTPNDKLLFLYGDGSNGKSALINSIFKAAGDYAVSLPEKTLLTSQNDHPTEKMPLRGARLAFLEELPEGGVLPAKRLKDLVGTPQITARQIGKDNVTWDASHTLFISTNHLPVVYETDTATWRRMRVLPFKKRFVSGEEPLEPGDVIGDANLKERITENSSGQLDAVLSWIIDGAFSYYKAGSKFTLPEPESVKIATKQWRNEQDTLFQFLEKYIEKASGHEIATVDFAAAFNGDQILRGKSTWSLVQLNKQISKHPLARKLGMSTGPIRRRQGQGVLSRPAGLEALPLLGAQFQAWVGVKFRIQDDN